MKTGGKCPRRHQGGHPATIRAANRPPSQELRHLFVQSGVTGELERYSGVHHGFACPQRWCYDKPAVKRYWERLLALHRQRLGQGTGRRGTAERQSCMTG
ncbi:MAG: dienelactone hydrolase family protein [Candidatus Tectimicrobiota bacterium]